MLTRQVRWQLVAFAIIAVVALTIASVVYVGLPQMLGFGRFTVTADFADTSGLYPSANVTYRGVDVGKVDSLQLTKSGVRVVMKINDGSRIPTDAQAQIHSTSAIGEQYVDLVPDRSGGPYLANDSVIPRASTVEMPQTSPLLDKLDSLLDSIPKQRLSAVLADLNVAFDGSGPAINSIISNGSSLVAEAKQQLGATTSLIANLDPFLTQQQQLAGQTSSYVGNLSSFTSDLAAADPGIRSLIAEGPATGSAVSSLVQKVEPTLPILLSGLVQTGQVIYTYLPAVQELLVLTPAAVSSYEKIFLVGLPNTAEIDFELNVNNPPPCLQGYLPPSQYVDPGSSVVADTPEGLHCSLPQSAPESVRGTRNLPCLDPASVVQRAYSVEACEGKDPEPYPSTQEVASTTAQVATYEPTTGRFLAPNGEFFALSPSTVASGNGPTTLQGLLTPFTTS